LKAKNIRSTNTPRIDDRSSTPRNVFRNKVLWLAHVQSIFLQKRTSRTKKQVDPSATSAAALPRSSNKNRDITQSN